MHFPKFKVVFLPSASTFPSIFTEAWLQWILDICHVRTMQSTRSTICGLHLLYGCEAFMCFFLSVVYLMKQLCGCINHAVCDNCRLADLQTCGLADCGRADLRTCRLADLRTCGLADLKTCRPGESAHQQFLPKIVFKICTTSASHHVLTRISTFPQQANVTGKWSCMFCVTLTSESTDVWLTL